MASVEYSGLQCPSAGIFHAPVVSMVGMACSPCGSQPSISFCDTESELTVLVSLRDFAVTGSFGPVFPGCTPSELESWFGPPEATGGQSRRHRHPNIWKYGDQEFFFKWPTGLHTVFCDSFFGPDEQPAGWGDLKLDPWCIRRDLPIADFLLVAEAAGCEWQVRNEPRFERDVVTLASGVEVQFTRDSEYSPDGLAAIWRKWNVAE